MIRLARAQGQAEGRITQAIKYLKEKNLLLLRNALPFQKEKSLKMRI